MKGNVRRDEKTSTRRWLRARQHGPKGGSASGQLALGAGLRARQIKTRPIEDGPRIARAPCVYEGENKGEERRGGERRSREEGGLEAAVAAN